MHSTDSDDKDTCTLLEWATGPLLLIALMAFCATSFPPGSTN